MERGGPQAAEADFRGAGYRAAPGGGLDVDREAGWVTQGWSREITYFLGHFFLEKCRFGLNANVITLTLITAGGD